MANCDVVMEGRVVVLVAVSADVAADVPALETKDVEDNKFCCNASCNLLLLTILERWFLSGMMAFGRCGRTTFCFGIPFGGCCFNTPFIDMRRTVYCCSCCSGCRRCDPNIDIDILRSRRNSVPTIVFMILVMSRYRVVVKPSVYISNGSGFVPWSGVLVLFCNESRCCCCCRKARSSVTNSKCFHVEDIIDGKIVSSVTALIRTT